MFQGVIGSLTNGGIPASPDILPVLASFMHMLTLNSDAQNLLIESKLIQIFLKICLQPEKYHRYVALRRTDDYRTEQMLQNVANSNVSLCQQMFQTILEVSKEIVPRSLKLTKDYVEMDLKLREIEK